MKLAISSLAVLALCALTSSPLHAQRAGGQVPISGAPFAPPAVRSMAPAQPQAEQALDRVVAVVNDEAITQYEVDQSKARVVREMNEAKVPLPPPDVLQKQVLERLINEKALLQYAKETGIRVDDNIVEATIVRVAQENKMTLDQLRAALEHDHIPYNAYREDIRRELTIQRVRYREVEQKLFVSDAEVDNYLANQAAQGGGGSEYLLSHIYVSVPDQATPDQIEQRRKRAEQALADVQAGKDFGQVAASYSDAPDALQGGNLGWRTPAKVPTVFGDILKTLQKGQVSQVVRSPAGFHIVKVVDIRNLNSPTVVDQTHVEHILVKVNESVSESEAKVRIDRIRDNIVAGAKFEDQAKVNSEDSSSAKGGDLGWLSPGDTLPEFEKAYMKLKVGELSEPVRTAFGWHLIKVLERRQQDVTRDRQRAQAMQAIKQRKSEEQFTEFVRQTRDQAYVEIKTDDARS
ncbi:MAG: peptidylprolyl isomerase [Proteobacteria bacterium]|nr:peptidylprolyl isomerase [Pseudomonadota bacterium]